jgi:hypothetical protein
MRRVRAETSPDLLETLVMLLVCHVLHDPALQVTQRFAVGLLRQQRNTQLGLASRSLNVEHQPTRHLLRKLTAVVLAYQRQREVHACAHRPGRFGQPTAG